MTAISLSSKASNGTLKVLFKWLYLGFIGKIIKLFIKTTKLYVFIKPLWHCLQPFRAIIPFYIYAVSRAVHLSFQKKIYDGTLFSPAENKAVSKQNAFTLNSYQQKFSTLKQ